MDPGQFGYQVKDASWIKLPDLNYLEYIWWVHQMGGWAPFKSGYKENKEKKTQEISFDGHFLSIS